MPVNILEKLFGMFQRKLEGLFHFGTVAFDIFGKRTVRYIQDLITLISGKGYLFVQMGIIRSKVHISDLELVDEPVITTPSMQRTGAGKIRMSKAASISTEINLLGKTVDEAVAELDKYLDDAYIAHMKSVRIVHGKGTGALRKGVHNYLKRQKHVASFRLGEFGEGDAGVTIVEFKK